MTEPMPSESTRSGVAVVTGASRGLGAAIAERLAAQGLSVACGATTAANAEPVADRIRSQFGAPGEGGGVEAIAVEMRVEDADSVAAGFAKIEAELGPVTVMVNNAGISGVSPFLDMPVEDFDRVLDVNVRGVFIGAQTAARAMVASDTRGVIVNIGSIAASDGFPHRLGYGASKAAVHQMTKIMALDLADQGIRVCGVAPGYIMTDMIQDLVDEGKVDQSLIEGRIPMSELGSPEDIAAAVAWISSPEARYVTGETLYVDGGWLAYGHV